MKAKKPIDWDEIKTVCISLHAEEWVWRYNRAFRHEAAKQQLAYTGPTVVPNSIHQNPWHPDDVKTTFVSIPREPKKP